MQDILDARKSTHGDFRKQFKCARDIKDAFWSENGCWDETPAVYSEALDQIAHKISRILTGNPNHADHWRDIAGYATCIADMLDEPAKKASPLAVLAKTPNSEFQQAIAAVHEKSVAGFRRVSRYTADVQDAHPVESGRTDRT